MAKQFDYRDYVVIDPSIAKDSELYRGLVTVLEQMASTEEGRQMLRDAKENQGKKIRVFGDESYASIMGYLPDGEPYININLDQLDSMRYGDAAGRYHEYTLNRLFYHELSHAADPHLSNAVRQEIKSNAYRQLYNAYGPADENATDAEVARYVEEVLFTDPENGATYKKMVSSDIAHQWSEIRKSHHTEDIAVQAENAYMEKYFGEAPRRGYDGPGDVDMHGTRGSWLYAEFPDSSPHMRSRQQSAEYSGIDLSGIEASHIRFAPDGKSEKDLSTMMADLRKLIARDAGGRDV